MSLVIRDQKVLHVPPGRLGLLDRVDGHPFIGAGFHQRIVLLDLVFQLYRRHFQRFDFIEDISGHCDMLLEDAGID